MTDLNKLAQELHEAAVAKGFWDVEDAEIKHIAKMHSELSEAVQEDRCGRPMLYVDDVEVKDRITDPAMFDGRKPEGVAAELADFVMMVLDWAKQRGETIASRALHYLNIELYEDVSLPHLVNEMHRCIMDINKKGAWSHCVDIQFAYMVCSVDLWLKARGIDLWQVIHLKMEYNKNRPKLHGRLY